MSAATSTILAGVGIAAGAGESLIGHGGGSAPKDPFGDKIKQQQLDLSNKESSAGFGDLSTARKTFQLPINYWSKILTGGRYDALEALAPEVNTITSQYDAGTRAMSEFSPRSGGRTSAMEENRFRKNADITKTLLGARPAAAQGLLSAASGIGAMGTGELSSASSALSGASSTNAQQQQLALERQRMANENASGIGSGLGSIFATLLNNRNGSSSTAGSDPSVLLGGSDPSICWIAMAMWGDTDPRVTTIRTKLLAWESRSRIGERVVALYRMYGRRIARRPWAVNLLRPVFNLALERL